MPAWRRLKPRFLPRIIAGDGRPVPPEYNQKRMPSKATIFRHLDGDGRAQPALKDAVFVVIYLVILPWDYIWRNYVVARGDRWW